MYFNQRYRLKDGRCRVLTPSLRVINSRTPNLCFRRPCSFLWFSIVSYNNYGGDSKTSFYKNFIFLVRHPVAISVVTNGDSTGDFRELGHLIKYIKLMWLFQIFFFVFLLLFFFSLFSFSFFFFCPIFMFVLFYFILFLIIYYYCVYFC